jgi:hypothetical protein
MKRRHHYETRPAPTDENEDRELPLSYSWWKQNDPNAKDFDGFIGFARDKNKNCCYDCLCNDECELVEICTACPSVPTPREIIEYRFQATGCENEQDDPETPDLDETEHKFGWKIGTFPTLGGGIVPETERWRKTHEQTMTLMESYPSYKIGYYYDPNQDASFSQYIRDDEGELVECSGSMGGFYSGGGKIASLEPLSPFADFVESNEYEGIFVPSRCNRTGGIYRGSTGTIAWTDSGLTLAGLDNTSLGGGIVNLIKPPFPNAIEWAKCPPKQ